MDSRTAETKQQVLKASQKYQQQKIKANKLKRRFAFTLYDLVGVAMDEIVGSFTQLGLRDTAGNGDLQPSLMLRHQHLAQETKHHPNQNRFANFSQGLAGVAMVTDAGFLT